VPGVVYGFGAAATPVQVDEHALRSLLREHAGHGLIALTMDGREEMVVLKDLQHDPLSRALLHVDFQRVRMDAEVTVEATITLDGKPRGVQEGGIVEFLTRTIPVRALPASIPETIHLDISALGIGDSVHVRDLVLPEGLTAVADDDTVIVTVAAPHVAVEPTAEAPAEEAEEQQAEPERIGRVRDEDERK
jgi:large subunit ribosomal protein L25